MQQNFQISTPHRQNSRLFYLLCQKSSEQEKNILLAIKLFITAADLVRKKSTPLSLPV